MCLKQANLNIRYKVNLLFCSNTNNSFFNYFVTSNPLHSITIFINHILQFFSKNSDYCFNICDKLLIFIFFKNFFTEYFCMLYINFTSSWENHFCLCLFIYFFLCIWDLIVILFQKIAFDLFFSKKSIFFSHLS